MIPPATGQNTTLVELEKGNIDLMQAVIVNMGDANAPVKNQILRLMNVLLSDTTGTKEKKRIMEDEFHIAMSKELESEVQNMCDLSQGIYEKGVKQDIEQGIERGLNRGIIGAIEMLREDGKEDKVIIERIMRKYHLTRAEAEAYVLEACTV